MILDDVKIRVSINAGKVNTGTTAPRKFISDKLKLMLADYLNTNKIIKIMVQVEKNGKKYREYYTLNDEA